MNRPRTLVGSAVPFVLLIGLVGIVPAAAASAPTDDDDARALALLRRAVIAATSLGYSGTQVVTSWRPGGDTARLVAVQQWPDGRRVETVRDASVPGSAPRRTVGSAVDDSGLQLSLRALDVLTAGYRLTVSGGGVVAGRVATVVDVRRGDAVAARMWVDEATGLLLRQEVNDAAGNVRRMFFFADVRIGVPGGAAAVPSVAGDVGPRRRSGAVSSALVRTSPNAGSAGAAVVQPWRGAASQVQRHGWCASVSCPEALPAGFRLLDVRRGSVGGADVVHLVYGDGLSSISVFQQAGRLDPEHLGGFRAAVWDGAEVYVGEGWPARITWQGGTRVFTAVSDAASSDLHAAITAFPHDRAEPDGGALAAIGRGMRSVLEWLQGE